MKKTANMNYSPTKGRIKKLQNCFHKKDVLTVFGNNSFYLFENLV